MNPQEIILYPLMGEKATMMRDKNILTFVVSKESRKKEVKNAVEELYKVKVTSVNIINTTEGKKKAHVRLDSKYSAEEIATQLGVI
ncbi:MAG: 50S ribosomal protein L23 [Candidatus Altiarchaeota archaeon]|nr:50S ribosomal protein L23 [Candidatus Altiarchaeota archaeon]